MQTGGSATQIGMMDCVRLTLKEEGVRGFYKGMQSPLAGEGFFNAVQFLVYGASKRLLLERTEGFGVPAAAAAAASSSFSSLLASPAARSELSVPEYFMAGGMTGFACTFVETPVSHTAHCDTRTHTRTRSPHRRRSRPRSQTGAHILFVFCVVCMRCVCEPHVHTQIDLFKTQLQVQIFRSSPAFTSFAGCMGHIWCAGGVRGVFQGLAPTFLRTVPASAAYFGSYEATKASLVAPHQTKADLGSAHLLFAGGCGGVAYWLSSFPADTIKSSMQSDAVQRHERQYKSVLDCATKLWREGGLRRFYRGLAPCLIRSFPANAACFFAYEKALQWMQTL